MNSHAYTCTPSLSTHTHLLAARTQAGARRRARAQRRGSAREAPPTPPPPPPRLTLRRLQRTAAPPAHYPQRTAASDTEAGFRLRHTPVTASVRPPLRVGDLKGT